MSEPCEQTIERMSEWPITTPQFQQVLNHSGGRELNSQNTVPHIRIGEGHKILNIDIGSSIKGCPIKLKTKCKIK